MKNIKTLDTKVTTKKNLNSFYRTTRTLQNYNVENTQNPTFRQDFISAK